MHGHWEGDLLRGKRPTGIATLVERTQPFHAARRASRWAIGPSRCGSALAQSIATLPVELRRSLTWDQYFSQRSDLAVGQEQLDAVAAELKGRPRKMLGWSSPAERYGELLAGARC